MAEPGGRMEITEASEHWQALGSSVSKPPSPCPTPACPWAVSDSSLVRGRLQGMFSGIKVQVARGWGMLSSRRQGFPLLPGGKRQGWKQGDSPWHGINSLPVSLELRQFMPSFFHFAFLCLSLFWFFSLILSPLFSRLSSLPFTLFIYTSLHFFLLVHITRRGEKAGKDSN